MGASPREVMVINLQSEQQGLLQEIDVLQKAMDRLSRVATDLANANARLQVVQTMITEQTTMIARGL